MANQQQYWQFEVFGTDSDLIGFFGNAGIILPSGSTAQRPSSAASGHIRFNTDTSQFEGFTGAIWEPLGGGGGSGTFLGLTDTPGVYTGTGNRVVKVSAGEGSLEFTPSLEIENSGRVRVSAGYEALVTADEVVPNKKYTDDQDNLQLSLTGGLMGGVITMGSNSILGLPLTPTSNDEAASKGYVDNLFAGIDRKESVNLATTTDLDTETGDTWVAAGAKVGKTLTSDAGTATIDTVALVNGDRLLVKNESGDIDNGIYDVSGVGGAAVVLTRSSDTDGSPVNEVNGGTTTFVVFGATNGLTQWSVIANGLVDVDVDTMIWTPTGAVAGAFLPLIGGTMTGTVIMGAAGIQISGDTTTPTAPVYSFTGDLGTGLHQIGGSGTMSLVIGTAPIWNITPTALNPAVTLTQDIGAAGLKIKDVYADHFLPNFGAAGDPSYAFEGAATTGMYNGGSGDIRFAVGGTRVVTIESNGTLSVDTASYETIVLADNDIPNKKYVDDSITSIIVMADADLDTQIQVEEAADEDIIRFDTGETPVGFGAVANIMTIASSGMAVAMGTANVATTPGAPISLTGGTGNTTGDGGVVSLIGGDGGTTGAGGAISLTGGNGGASSGNGGAVSITGGNASYGIGGAVNIATGTSTGYPGGSITITSGTGADAYAGGSIDLIAGGGGMAGAGGPINLTAGAGSSASGGAVTITAGSSTTSNSGGPINLTAGSGSSFNGGAITLTAGSGSTVKGTGSGADVSLVGGTAITSGNGGSINLTAGNGTAGEGYGGNIVITSGTGYYGGNINLTTPASAFGQPGSGNIRLSTGTSVDPNIPGDILLTPGIRLLDSNLPGDVVIGSEGSPPLLKFISGGSVGSLATTYVALRHPGSAPASSFTLELPQAPPTVNAQALVSTTGGVMSFSSGIGAGFMQDQDGDTAITLEASNDEDVIRFNTGDTPVGYGAVTDLMTLASSGLAVSMGTADVATTVGAPISLTAGVGNTTGVGGIINITGGQGGVTAVGGAVSLTGGAGGVTSGAGGDATLRGGNATTSGAGGDANVIAGTGLSVGGNVNLTAGSSSGADVGGVVTIDGGVGGVTGNGGPITITAGAGGATSGDGGNVSVISGAAATDGIGGAINLTAGAGAGASKYGGPVNLTGGVGSGTARGGNVEIYGGASDANAASNGGSVRIGGGSAVDVTGGAGGNVNLYGGGGAGANAGGSIEISAGDGSDSGSGIGGRVLILGGDGGSTGDGREVDIRGGNGGSGGTTVGGFVSLTGGSGHNAGAGGIATLQGGGGGSTTGAAGAAIVRGGSLNGGATGIQWGVVTVGGASNASTNGAEISMVGGIGNGTTGVGGAINVTGGAASPSGTLGRNGGDINITTGAGGGTGQANGGALTLAVGASAGGRGGAVLINAGPAATASEDDGGDIRLTAGDAGLDTLGNDEVGGLVRLQGGNNGTYGGNIELFAGDSLGTLTQAQGGDIILTAGDNAGTNTSGTRGGNVDLTAGSGGVNGEYGGYVTLRGGVGYYGGKIELFGANANAANGQFAGGIDITAGTGATGALGGFITIIGGEGAGGAAGGNARIRGGHTYGGGNGGHVWAYGGFAESGGNGGDVHLRGGSRNGGGTVGSVILESPGTLAGETTELRFAELTGAQYVGFKAPDAITTNVMWTLPSAAATVNGQILSSTTAGILSWISASAAAGAQFTQSFTNATLTAGVLTATHSLGRQYVHVTVYDNNDIEIQADTITATSTSVATIDLSSFGALTGTWNVVIS